jgi:hypothetical protein
MTQYILIRSEKQTSIVAMMGSRLFNNALAIAAVI